jgi:hypothetical protein
MAFPDINIGSKFDAKGFKQAETATAKLNKNVKSLGRSLGIAFSVAAITAYGKAASKAALDDSKAQAILANNLKNVGLAYASIPAEQFISNMQKQTGILDDFLRPAYSQLAQVTGSVAKTQELLNVAFDASAGAGLDYASTVDILSQAYVGNFKGIKQLNLGLTQAELAAMSFAEIQDKITATFQGAGQASLRGFSGQLSLLNVELADTKETIGKSLINLLASFSGGKGIGGASDSVAKLASGVSSTVNGISKLTSNIKIATPVLVGAGIAIMAAWSPWLLGIAAAVAIIGKIGNTIFKTPEVKTGYGQQSPAERTKAVVAAKLAADSAKKRAAAEKAAAASVAAQLKDKKEQAKLDKATAAAQLALNKGADVFDIEKIQLNAALIGQAEALGKATTGAQVLAIANDVARLRIKQDILALEEAIASKDTQAIIAATAKLNADLKVLSVLQSQNFTMLSIKSILDTLMPKELIDQANLDIALAKIKEMLLLLAGLTGGGGPVTKVKKEPEILKIPKLEKLTGKESISAILEVTDAVAVLADVMAQIQEQENYAQYISLVEFQKKLGDFGGYSTSMGGGAGSSTYGYSPVVTVEVIDKTSGLIEVVQTAVQENNRFGNNLNFAGAL